MQCRDTANSWCAMHRPAAEGGRGFEPSTLCSVETQRTVGVQCIGPLQKGEGIRTLDLMQCRDTANSWCATHRPAAEGGRGFEPSTLCSVETQRTVGVQPIGPLQKGGGDSNPRPYAVSRHSEQLVCNP